MRMTFIGNGSIFIYLVSKFFLKSYFCEKNFDLFYDSIVLPKNPKPI